MYTSLSVTCDGRSREEGWGAVGARAHSARRCRLISRANSAAAVLLLLLRGQPEHSRSKGADRQHEQRAKVQRDRVNTGRARGRGPHQLRAPLAPSERQPRRRVVAEMGEIVIVITQRTARRRVLALGAVPGWWPNAAATRQHLGRCQLWLEGHGLCVGSEALRRSSRVRRHCNSGWRATHGLSVALSRRPLLAMPTLRAERNAERELAHRDDARRRLGREVVQGRHAPLRRERGDLLGGRGRDAGR